jgi:DNA (cytosine-5)-methyltransferase 1
MINNQPKFAVDLFSGCGGLTLGLRQAGFIVSCAVEVDPIAAKTYRFNNRKTKLIEKNILEVSGKEIIANSPKKLNLLTGCAPCQGFCSLTSKYLREDPRNTLILRMADLIGEMQPDAVFMENVPGLISRGKTIFDQFLSKLRYLGYYPSYTIVQMANYGVPQSRRRLVLLAGRGFAISFPEETHARKPEEGSTKLPWVTVRRAISHLAAPITLSKVSNKRGPQAYNWHVVRNLQSHTRDRLEAAMPGSPWTTLNESLRPECHRNGYNGFTNVYGRMRWDDVSVTITAGCTTPCKGRFGHPDRRRTTISVREAAILQTFPESYKFRTDYMDHVCQMIGNAVPPLFAHLVGRKIMKALEAHYGALARKSKKSNN